MLNLHGITTRLFPSTNPTPITIGPGFLVKVETRHGTQTGIIERIAKSPYCGEETLFRARVGSLPGEPFFIDYLLVEELVPAEADFELEDDPEYLQYIYETEAAEREQELEDEDSYRHPRFLWNGRWFPESID